MSATMEPRPGGIRIPSTLWIDQPDAAAAIATPGRFSADLAARLSAFEAHGYVTFSLDANRDAVADLPGEVEQLWRDRPDDVVFAASGPPRWMSEADPDEDRRPGTRLHDIHSHLPAARALYLDEQILETVEAILGEEAVAIQSLYFEHGSEQALHRDEVVVPVAEPGHLVAAWIALEDLAEDCGPLVYVPGSHRMPCFETEPGEYRFDSRRMGAELVETGLQWEAEEERRAGLEARRFTARRGEVLLWHGALRHGGSPVENPNATRRSFVVHFSSRRTTSDRSISVLEKVGEEQREEWRVYTTECLLGGEGRKGFANPVAPMRDPAAS